MAMSSAAKVEQDLLATVSLLSPTQKREALDFMTFIATQRRSKPKAPAPLRRIKPTQSIAAIFDLAAGCTDTDISVNHDKYLYGDGQPWRFSLIPEPCAHEIINGEAENIFRKYDLPRLSFTDCTSFALINAHRINHVFSFDEHFRIFRFDHPVTLLGIDRY